MTAKPPPAGWRDAGTVNDHRFLNGFPYTRWYVIDDKRAAVYLKPFPRKSDAMKSSVFIAALRNCENRWYLGARTGMRLRAKYGDYRVYVPDDAALDQKD